MAEIECRTRRIGGSIGVILPKDVVEKESIEPDQNITIRIRSRVKVKDVFGMFPNWKTPTQRLKNEARKGW
ncbi:MAG: hypothetical protein HY517_00580 [Candidatus Aenigmarchaeota archaeon]|nr:hypothetical protein [Candidatus Aenigmarchaeota archaeon]